MSTLELFKPIRTFVFDIDGVMTDGTVHVLPDGQHVRRLSIRDGYAIKLAAHSGYIMIALSGTTQESAVKRLQELKMKYVFTDVTDKEDQMLRFAKYNHLDLNTCLYMGDDIPDYKAMKLVSLPVCPADAAPEIKSISKYISPYNGGYGCVREVIEKVLKLNGHWPL